MAIYAGTSGATASLGSLGVRVRLGSRGVIDAPEGLAILDVSISNGVTTLVHSLATPNGSAVSYEYEHQLPNSGPPLFVSPLAATWIPISTETDRGFVQVQGDEYDEGVEYTLRVRAVNNTGSTVAEVVMPSTEPYPQSWPEGSLPDVLQDEFASLSPDARAAVFADGQRDEETWFYPVDLRGVAATEKGGTLVTPLHAIFAAHYPPAVGSTVTFYDASTAAGISRTVESVAIHPQYDSVTYRNDLAVARLSSEVSLPHYPVLPADWARYIPSTNPYPRLPLLAFERGASSQEVSSPLLEIVSVNGLAIQLAYRAAELRPSIVSGDSGQPLFFVLNGEAVLAGVWTNKFAGPFVSDHIETVNQMISQLGGGYQLTTVDLSDFPTY